MSDPVTTGVLGYFGAKKLKEAVTPEIPAMPKPPKPDSSLVQKAMAAAARKRRTATGHRSTILSQMMPAGSPALKQSLGE